MHSRVLLIPLFATLLISCQSSPPASPASPEAATPNLDGLAANGRYDEALRLGEQALAARPGDPRLLNKMIEWSFARAHRQPEQREPLLLQATAYADQAAGANSQDPMVVWQSARTFQKAGDLSKEQSCTFYNRALELLRKREPLLQEGAPLPRGGASHLKFLREDNLRQIDELRSRLRTRNCNYWVD